MELGLCYQLVSLADSTAILPPDPVVAHITRVGQSRLSTTRLQCCEPAGDCEAFREISARMLGDG